MANATLPTVIGLALAHQKVKIWVDNPPSIKPLTRKNVPINGTNFQTLQSNNADYTVPASTNLRIYGIEDAVGITAFSAASTVFQLGYADDNAGTNFVSLADLTSWFGPSTGLSSTLTIIGIPLGILTVPAGKLPQLKQTNTLATGACAIQVIGIETA